MQIESVTDLISSECPMRSLEPDAAMPACCEGDKEAGDFTERKPVKNRHQWLDPDLIEKLPFHIKKGEDRQ